MSELIIDSSNFSEYFFDTRKHRPQKGQVMARFSAIAVFSGGSQKRDVVELLTKDKAHAAVAVMEKIHLAKPPSSVKVCREICEDLLSGMTIEEVVEKNHEFVLEAFYYTQREYVPTDSLQWEMMPLLEYDKETRTYKSKIVF